MASNAGINTENVQFFEGVEKLLEVWFTNSHKEDHKEIFEIFQGFMLLSKNYKQPELQISPHCSFEEEVALLDSIFSDGEAYCLGDADKNCWYLYTLNRKRSSQGPKEPDQTLEILMTNLNSDVMSLFTRERCSSAAEATKNLE
ncbi:hypothetical protein G9C98_008147 [Cotesia typhae]|uniref:Uncharacterized protein n=1 Tax=Cotesia typhae TaxID=2053667 RepID=A0A8J5RGS2_9HYME|nr:hypothetical protein G9C98_008147 [Cotesia typhae]